MSSLHVERLSGLAGFGGSGSHIRSHGQVELSTLSEAEQATVEKLFQLRGKPAATQVRDGFRYKISRTTPSGTQTVEAGESLVPNALIACVKDEIV